MLPVLADYHADHCNLLSRFPIPYLSGSIVHIRNCSISAYIYDLYISFRIVNPLVSESCGKQLYQLEHEVYVQFLLYLVSQAPPLSSKVT